MNPIYRPLFEPLRLRSGVQLKNRLVMAPMTHYSSNPDGSVSDEELAYYGRRAAGVGTVVTACVYVTPAGKGFPGEFGIDTDELLPGLKRLAATIRESGAAAVLQLYHGGAECPPELVPGGEVVAPSAVAAREGTPVPRPLTEEEIGATIRAFGEATRRAIEAGFDGVELHGANGYLLQQFFSPHANRREDGWGGTREKRMAFPLAVVQEVRETIARHAELPFLLGYRFSPEEPHPTGYDMDDTLAFVDRLAGLELDYLHVSLMDFWSLPRAGVPDLSVPRIRLLLDTIAGRVPLIGVGSIRTADDALRALEAGAPLVALGRELVLEPDWARKIEEGRDQEIRTTLSRSAQRELVIPDPLWNAILSTPGWFPVEE
ncbi:putative NADH-dependent flavin oxidoreductase YqiG [Paenibacillus sp. J31TS4]|uniref:NADH-dependent flavin oxidoreductase n=1 Tax=Paenibacillus sp. J31TS4 TaxID=2807195 RepID=UPI001B2DEF58|nr:NADH-dependent flavin oxidoreductase [Paenibacillus sp. J31TS4]GIP39434.1 putative NADH-dependent flavin oxidoreductase YqiG [Paenibacillus sp. J31TS4]